MTSETGRNDNQDESWGPCPPGEICKLNHQLQSQVANSARNRRMIVTALVLLLLTPAALWSIQRLNHVKDLGGLTCEQVEAHFDGYAHHELDQNVTDQIETHLKNCPKCREHYEELQKKNDAALSLSHSSFAEKHPSSEFAFHVHPEFRGKN